jgi:diguanylate cyclase (GGDEF)-like protein
MTNVLGVMNIIFDLAFVVFYIFVFYISLRMCFLRDGQSKIRFFFIALVTNPITIFLLSVAIAVIFGIIRGLYFDGEAWNALTLSMIGGLIFIALTILLSWLVGRWVQAHNISLVIFLYLMFAVVYALSGQSVMENDAEHVIPPAVQSILLNIVYIGTVFILYRFVVRNLSELTDRKRQINSKMFLIPPSFFLPVYYVFNYLTYEYGDVLSNVVVNVYSMIVLALFVWAFSVVIMNINASNAAIEAQYEAEHDKLTGLYNKGKYMMLKENRFDNPGSIALFNYDVNNLKYINDNFGHEYGDELIIKAANSIHAVTTDNVFGFRMGGDEYAMVAVNVTEKEAERIYNTWKQALEELNTQGEVFCVMACGFKYSEGEFDPDELFQQADDLMYLDKKARKDKGETSHLRNAVETS